jgi:anti-sigma factor RsiW
MLARYLDGELTPAERGELEALLDDQDRARLAALTDIGAAVRAALAGESEPVDLWPGVEAGIERARRHARWQRARRPGMLGAGLLVAGAALMLLLAPLKRVRPTNECDIESLEVAGTQTAVFKVPDPERQGLTTTIIWTEEE